jgi:hypothetical protein
MPIIILKHPGMDFLETSRPLRKTLKSRACARARARKDCCLVAHRFGQSGGVHSQVERLCQGPWERGNKAAVFKIIRLDPRLLPPHPNPLPPGEVALECRPKGISFDPALVADTALLSGSEAFPLSPRERAGVRGDVTRIPQQELGNEEQYPRQSTAFHSPRRRWRHGHLKPKT